MAAKLYEKSPVLVEEGKGLAGNPWGAKFSAMFHMSNDSGLFRNAQQLTAEGFVREGTDWVPDGLRPRQGVLEVEGMNEGSLSLSGGGPVIKRYVPLYEAKMISFFDHRFGGYPEGMVKDTRALPRATIQERQDPNWEVSPRYWVAEAEVENRLSPLNWSQRWLMAVRALTNTNNERTVIPGFVPFCGMGHSLNVLLMHRGINKRSIAGLYANFSALVLDYVARQKVGGTNLSFFIVAQFPVLPPCFYNDSRLAFLLPKVLELTYTSYTLAPFARDLGHNGPPFDWDEERRAHLRAELDAFYARAYGLNRDELRYILDPADVMGVDYPSETFRVLKDKEIRQLGEYRTRRLVLAAWDRMEASGEFRELGL